MKRLTGKQVADALGWYYHDKPKESRRVMCDAAAETLNALANACSYESAHRLLRESRDFLEAAEFKESENAIAAQDVRDRIAIELGEWNADHEPNKSEGAATREGAGAAMRGPPSDPPTAWTEEQIGAAERIGDAYWRLERGTDTRAAFCAAIAKHAHLFAAERTPVSRDEISKVVLREYNAAEKNYDDHRDRGVVGQPRSRRGRASQDGSRRPPSASGREGATIMSTADHLRQARYDTACPKCCAYPFRPFLYGQVQRERGLGDLWRWIMRQPKLGVVTLICWNCKEIVGHE